MSEHSVPRRRASIVRISIGVFTALGVIVATARQEPLSPSIWDIVPWAVPVLVVLVARRFRSAEFVPPHAALPPLGVLLIYRWLAIDLFFWLRRALGSLCAAPDAGAAAGTWAALGLSVFAAAVGGTFLPWRNGTTVRRQSGSR